MVFGGMRFGAALLALGLWLASAPTQADEPSERIVAVRGDVEQMLMDGRTDELDAIADDYRASRARVRGGAWALSQFYYWLTPFVGSGCGCEPDISKVAFDDKRKAIEAWLERSPRSLTARIALADLWDLRAWQLRGVKYAKETSEAAWQGFANHWRESRRRSPRSMRPPIRWSTSWTWIWRSSATTRERAWSRCIRAQPRPFRPFPPTRTVL